MTLVKTLLWTVFAVGFVTVLLPYVLVTSEKGGGASAVGSFRFLGLVPIALGFSAYLWSAWEFATFGRGTPNPYDPPRVFVERGLYRFVRNPMYVGILLILAGEALLLESRRVLLYSIFALLAFHLRVILVEEPHLRELFGEEYKRYSSRVHRWVPALPPKRTT